MVRLSVYCGDGNIAREAAKVSEAPDDIELIHCPFNESAVTAVVAFPLRILKLQYVDMGSKASDLLLHGLKQMSALESIAFDGVSKYPVTWATGLCASLPHMQALKRLTISGFHNYLSAGDILGLMTALTQTNVSEFELRYGDVNDAAVYNLASVLPQTQIRSLSLPLLRIGNVGSECVQALGEAASKVHLRRLALPNNYMSRKTTTCLMRALRGSDSLEHIDLNFSDIDAAEAVELVKSCPELHIINLESGRISDDEARAMLSAWPARRQLKLLMTGNDSIEKSTHDALRRVVGQYEYQEPSPPSKSLSGFG